MKTKLCKLVGFVSHKDQVRKFCHFNVSSIVNLVDLNVNQCHSKHWIAGCHSLRVPFSEMVVRQTNRSPIPLQNLDKLRTDLRDAYG